MKFFILLTAFFISQLSFANEIKGICELKINVVSNDLETKEIQLLNNNVSFANCLQEANHQFEGSGVASASYKFKSKDRFAEGTIKAQIKKSDLSPSEKFDLALKKESEQLSPAEKYDRQLQREECQKNKSRLWEGMSNGWSVVAVGSGVESESINALFICISF